MKTTIIALLMTTAPAFAGPTENITGCATVAVDNTNYTVKADPNCVIAVNKGGDDFLMAYATEVFLDGIDPTKK